MFKSTSGIHFVSPALRELCSCRGYANREPDSGNLNYREENAADGKLQCPSFRHEREHREHVEWPAGDKVFVTTYQQSDYKDSHQKPAGDPRKSRPQHNDSDERTSTDNPRKYLEIGGCFGGKQTLYQNEMPDHESEVGNDR